MQWFSIVGIVLLVVMAIYLLDQLGLWMEHRGWIYWRKTKSKSSVLGAGAMALQDIFESGKATHIIEAKETNAGKTHAGGPGPI